MGSLSVGAAGTFRAAAVVASAPYDSRRDEPACTTTPRSTAHSAAGTPQVRAAAPTSISRACAEAVRSGSQRLLTLELPPVNCSPNLGSALACSRRTDSSGTSSSSATIMGSEVRTPWPISDLVSQRVMLPSGAIWSSGLGLSVAPARARAPTAVRA